MFVYTTDCLQSDASGRDKNNTTTREKNSERRMDLLSLRLSRYRNGERESLPCEVTDGCVSWLPQRRSRSRPDILSEKKQSQQAIR